ncbi:DUF1778 domain-containing protein [Paraconexibacter sp.]|uniref:type II toxin-antitoxin system TacA family antitoxin n=1 Tax=Paraconexibacter sp. TaxID=2949640 RepID=UPI003568A722
MAARTKRIEMRADVESEARISRAAALERVSVSAFVLGAATRAADDVLSQAEQTVMPAEQFDALMASLDVADRAPHLRKVARRKRAFDRA